jgi:hypothetical protein
MRVQIDQEFADKMLDLAISECAKVHFAGDQQRVRLSILRGECKTCKLLSHSLVIEIAKYLAQVDSTVKAVYQYEAEGEPESDEGFNPTGLHFIVWTGRKSAALNALADTLESALMVSQQKLGCVKTKLACYVLDMAIVDDRDVHEGRGLGLLISQEKLNSHLVWSRDDVTTQVPPQGIEEYLRVRYALPDSFDPEIIPESRLIDHALSIERLPPDERDLLETHLTELKVTLIRRIISDQLSYINIAKEWLTVADLEQIYSHRLGFGRIGGKSAGMLLAERVLKEVADEQIMAAINVPESFFLGSDLMYIFMAMNGLMHWNDQKYKSEDQIRSEYPRIHEEFMAGQFPPEILLELESVLEWIGSNPLIVRSSSQLEDSFGTSFAGKYDSHFCANQGTLQENLSALTQAIAKTYASTFKPDALLYRRSRGLQDYDERMAVLIQVVQGQRWDKYYLPFGAGVAFSRNLYRWAPQIQPEDGFVRMVWGLGTRAVERVGDDYPRLIALSHPTLHPDDSPLAIRRYSQRYVDLIDLEENSLKTLPVHEVLSSKYPPMRLLVQIERDGYFSIPHSNVLSSDIPNLAITFEGLLERTSFPSLLTKILQQLEQHLGYVVDIEFTVYVPDPHNAPSDVKISLLQCRHVPDLTSEHHIQIPANLLLEDTIFSSHFIVPRGYLSDVQYVIFVPPENYFALSDPTTRREIGKTIGLLNRALEKKRFICVGPGRWGTENIDLGVYVGYADICNAGALVELSGKGVGTGPEPSLGTHFFHDLLEAEIYPVTVNLDGVENVFNRDFFYGTSNCLRDWIDVGDDIASTIRLINVSSFRPGHRINLVMDDEMGYAVAFLVSANP